MSNKTIPSLLVMLLCSAGVAGAEVNGSVELGGTMLGVNGNKSKLNEYRDLGNGVTLGATLDATKDDLYFRFSGENFRYNVDTRLDNREVNVAAQAGQYDSNKLSLYYNVIPHNVSLGAKTFYTGVGSNVLTGPITNNNLATWNTAVDYKRDRTNYGAGVELSFKSPYFFGIRYDRTDMSGLNPTGQRSRSALAPAGTNFFTEFPSPVDYKTENFSAETGYRSKNLIFKVDGLISKFSNPYETMNIPGLTNVGATLLTLPPNNDYYKVGGSLMVKLPFNSNLMARANHSILEDNINLSQFPFPAATAPNFHGRVTYTTASVALTSNPIQMLETRVFYNLLDKQNKSNDSFNYGGVGFDTEKFAYHKQNAGIDAAVKLPAHTKASAGYEYQHLNRALRADAYSTTDHIVFVEAKNNALEMLTAKLRLQHMWRFSDNQLVAGTSVDSRFRRYDATDKKQEMIKAGVEIEPLHNLSIGVEYAYKLDSYDKTVIGMTSNRSHEINLDANYTIANVKLNAYADYEFTRFETNSHTGAFGVAATNAIYDYRVKRESVNYDYGINVDVDIIKNVLSAGLGWRYAYSNGDQSFDTNRVTAPLSTTPFPLVNIPADDDYTRQTLTAKLNYKISKNLGVSGGYSYERLSYSEGELNNYQNLVFANNVVTNPATGYLTGAFANQNFEAHVGFVKLAYSF